MSKHLLNESLLLMLKERRSRRFGLGMKIPEGALSYVSNKQPLPLSEEEEAILAFAACGITGPSLGDWAWGQGGNMLAGIIGRTIASADAIQNVVMFVSNDQATYMAKRPNDMTSLELREVVDLVKNDNYTGAWNKSRVLVQSKRADPPTYPPFNISPNMWSLHKPGTTYFLPVADLTFFLINVLLELMSEHEGFFPLDERHLFLPAGVAKFAKSKGGHLSDNANENKLLTIEAVERAISEMAAVEMGSMTQNLGLMCEAMGLGGFSHFSSHDSAWFKALGFEMNQMSLSKFFNVPFPASMILKLTKQNIPIEFPGCLKVNGEIVLKPFCPPYYKSMADAVHAVVDIKLGQNGLFRARANETPWKNSGAVSAKIPNISEKAIASTIKYCDYVWKKYQRFPAYLPPYHTLVGFQATHLDLDFYDQNYQSGIISDRHRDHFKKWHK